MRMKCTVAAFVLIGFGWLSAQAVNTKAPAFEGKTEEGRTIRLEAYTGKVVLLDFWASWCGPCREEMPFLVGLDDAYRDLGLVILAINIDRNAKNAEAFLSAMKTRPAFPILADRDSKIPPLYKLEGMPTTILVDRAGMIRFKHTGFKPEKKPQYREEIGALLNENQP
jgi:thiol-disulfide isomerase/thioredoxin